MLKFHQKILSFIRNNCTISSKISQFYFIAAVPTKPGSNDRGLVCMYVMGAISPCLVPEAAPTVLGQAQRPTGPVLHQSPLG